MEILATLLIRLEKASVALGKTAACFFFCFFSYADSRANFENVVETETFENRSPVLSITEYTGATENNEIFEPIRPLHRMHVTLVKPIKNTRNRSIRSKLERCTYRYTSTDAFLRNCISARETPVVYIDRPLCDRETMKFVCVFAEVSHSCGEIFFFLSRKHRSLLLDLGGNAIKRDRKNSRS